MDIIVGNDTGWDILSVFLHDPIPLGYTTTTYQGFVGNFPVLTADGICYRDKVLLEIQLVKLDRSSLTRWFVESAIVSPLTLPIPRLSGAGMRKVCYFAMRPGNSALYVAGKKIGDRGSTASGVSFFGLP